MDTHRTRGCVQPSHKFLSGDCDRTRLRSHTRTSFRTGERPGFKHRAMFYPSFGAISSRPRVRRRGRPHDLRRAPTRIAPSGLRHTDVGPVDIDVGAHRSDGRGGRGGCLRLRLGRSRRRRGRRGRREPHLAHSAVVPQAETHAHPDPHPTRAALHPDALPRPHADAAPHAEASEADADARADAHTTAAARPGTRAGGATAATDAAPGTRPAPRSDTDSRPDPQPDAACQAGPRPLRVPGDLPGLPPREGARPVPAQHDLTRDLRPAHHRPRGGGRGRPAAPLVPILEAHLA